MSSVKAVGEGPGFPESMSHGTNRDRHSGSPGNDRTRPRHHGDRSAVSENAAGRGIVGSPGSADPDLREANPSGTQTPRACPAETCREVRRGTNRQGRGKRRRRNAAGVESRDEERVQLARADPTTPPGAIGRPTSDPMLAVEGVSAPIPRGSGEWAATQTPRVQKAERRGSGREGRPTSGEDLLLSS
jgi:hypothetical protein